MEKMKDVKHLAFFFGDGYYPTDSDMSEDALTELAAFFHESPIAVRSRETLFDDIAAAARIYTGQAGFEDAGVTVEKGEDFSVWILEDGVKLARFEIDVMACGTLKERSSGNAYQWEDFEG